MPTKLKVGLTITNQEMDNILLNTQDFLTGNEHPIVDDKTPKNQSAERRKLPRRQGNWTRVLRFHRFPYAGRGMARRKVRPEKEIKIQNDPRKPAGMEQKLYHQNSKSWIVSNDSQSKKVVGIGFEHDLKIISRKHLHLIWLRLYDEFRYPVGKALLGMELKIDGLPEDIPNPAKVERQQHIMKAKRIQRWRIWYRMYQNPPLTWSGSWMSFFTEWISTRRIIKRVGSTNQRCHCYSINLLL